MSFANIFVRRSLSSVPKICIVGSGPAGFYTAGALLKGHSSLEIDMLERLPVPFGLVRYGVAPDHPDVKRVDSTFSQIAENSRFNFFGNVRVGGEGDEVTFSKLREYYHVVVLAYGGASKDKTLNIPGESLANVISGKSFVGFYNGHPDHETLNINVNTETAVIIGMGNVALDIARILLTSPEALKQTDMTEKALETLKESRIKRVEIIGRRGPLDVSFTIKEFREMLHLPNVASDFSSSTRNILLTTSTESLERRQKRLTELMKKTAETRSTISMTQKSWNLRCLRRPKVIHGVDSVSGITLGKNTIDQVGKISELSENDEYLETGLIFRSIGYKSSAPASDIPFDDEKGLIPNVNGRVDEGLYVAGWLGTGARGAIVNTMNHAQLVGRTILHDISFLKDESKGGLQDIKSLLKNVVTWEDWKTIDDVERRGITRTKITNVKSFLKILETKKR